MKPIARLLIAVLLAVGLWVGTLPGAIALPLPHPLATLHTYPDINHPQQVMHRSLQTLRDEAGQAWQAVFYKQVKNGLVQSIHLRLVGFPGISEFDHGRSLTLRDGQGHRWEAPDVFGSTTLDPSTLPHISEYDIRPIAEALNTSRPLWLDLPLSASTTTAIPVPPFAMREWQQLLDQ